MSGFNIIGEFLPVHENVIVLGSQVFRELLLISQYRPSLSKKELLDLKAKVFDHCPLILTMFTLFTENSKLLRHEVSGAAHWEKCSRPRDAAAENSITADHVRPELSSEGGVFAEEFAVSAATAWKAFDSKRRDKMEAYSKNPHLKTMETDVLYHLAIDNKSSDLKRMFEDVKYVVMGGSPSRMKVLADILLKELSIELPPGHGLINISGGSDRYALYKAGPIICVSHGMGNPSIAILLHEIVKLIDHAGCKDVIFLRLGTSGGLGLKPGSVVISDGCMDGLFRPYLTLNILGKTIKRPAVFQHELVEEFKEVASSFTEFDSVTAKTLCANDFYEEQARLDGAICDYTEEQKFEFLNKAYEQGVRNIEMESMCFAATTHHLGIKAVVICVTLVDRMQGDQILASKADMAEWQERPALVAARYFRHAIGIKSPSYR